MTTTNPAVAAAASELIPLLAGKDADEAWAVVRAYASEHSMKRSTQGISSADPVGGVYIGRDIVIKRNMCGNSIEGVPEEFRPEQVVVYGAGLDDFNRIVIQPRYFIPTDKLTEWNDDMGTRRKLQQSPKAWAFAEERGRSHYIDAHEGNWAFREDGSPVLIDW